MARELIILPRFKRDYRNARKHAEFDVETLEYVFDALISGERLPPALREHRLGKRNNNWSGFTECHLGSDQPWRSIRPRTTLYPAPIWERT